MAENPNSNRERGQAAKLRQQQNKARRLQKAGAVQKNVGKTTRAGGAAVEGAGRGIKKGGQSLMRSGAAMSRSGIGLVAGAPMMAAGAAAAAVGYGTQKVGKVAKGAGRGVEKGGRVASLRGRTLEKKAEAKAKKDKEDKQESLVAGLASRSALRAAWLALIPSWGLSLLYINLHVFLRWLFPSFFCKLGDEWLPRAVKKAGGDASGSIRIGEIMLLFAINLLLGLIILMSIGLVMTIIDPLLEDSNPVTD